MGLPAFLNFSNNIRTHATFVGVMVSLDAAVTLLLSLAWTIEEDKLPDNIKQMTALKEGILVMGIVNSLFALLYWIGYLKRQRWCLTVFIGFMAIAITLQFIGLLGAMLQLNFVSACVMLIVLAINGYVLLVVLQLRKANSEFTMPQQGVYGV
ncbi:AGAP007320-PA [Anopheles gambiae str. PEST]|uniref:AGAP007320-PA n=1 Tax=Anopheles gambiae TaxID=7165 RepID=A7URG8_ANOGA|nr:AGAP007320-PA [Anopheles gambiae str. PEST]